MAHKKFIGERGELILQYNICIGDLKVIYSLHKNSIESEERSSYSISVTSDDDFACAYDVTSIKDEAILLLDTVYRGEVTPCTLFDILEDILGTV